MNKEQEYNKLWHQAYGVAMYILHNTTDAEDVAQTTTIKYYLKEDEIENSSAWIKKVAKHEAIKLAKKQNKTYSLDTDLLVDQKNIPTAVDLDKYTETDYEPPEDLTVSKQEAKKLLSKEEYKIYKCYLNCKTDINKFAQKMNLSYHAASTKIYQIKRNLRATKYQKEGYIGTKKIVGYNLNRKIVTFIKTLVKKLNENDIKSLRKYFKLCETDNDCQIKIKKILDYEISKESEQAYHLFIPYITDNNQPQCIQIHFNVDNKSHIRISKYTFKTNQIYKVKMSKKEFLSQLPAAKKGVIPINLKETKQKFNL
ncbi:MAG: sigma-70 family RNA polymerase sigma factor [Candidatus Cloacimonetes bacterium]|jgi:DNA-directed RNA polymerase specialized sigma24 family protein|nr:sigma-70 family RNA polymerase sigma factor [Candidatus Cloacimonadota bacterium]MBT7470071.1 sigma-70 family RNA polymerase sigma factor [Candidatus Cloacimonadota bacterium]